MGLGYVSDHTCRPIVSSRGGGSISFTIAPPFWCVSKPHFFCPRFAPGIIIQRDIPLLEKQPSPILCTLRSCGSTRIPKPRCATFTLPQDSSHDLLAFLIQLPTLYSCCHRILRLVCSIQLELIVLPCSQFIRVSRRCACRHEFRHTRHQHLPIRLPKVCHRVSIWQFLL